MHTTEEREEARGTRGGAASLTPEAGRPVDRWTTEATRSTTAVRYVDRSVFEQTNGHTVDGVCDSFLTHDFGQDEYDLILGYNSVFYAMNDPDVDEYALLRRILSALIKKGGGGGGGGDSGGGCGGKGGDGGGGSDSGGGGGRFITDYTTAGLVTPLPAHGFEDVVMSTIGKGVRATRVYTRQ